MLHSEAQEAKDQTSKDNKYTPITLERGGGGEGEGEGDEPFLHPDGNLHSDGNLAVQRDLKITQVSVPEEHGLRKLLAYVGPGFLVAIAYLDPGNFESDLQAGARYKYEDGCRYNIIECSLALLLSFTINVAVVSVSGAVCSNASLSDEDKANCSNLDLNRAPFLLKHVLGKWSSTLFGIALLASGQSSTITGTYAGQYVMQGFLQLRFAPWIRNMLTRCVAIIPSLVAALIGGSSGAGNLIVMSSMILSFELPFALLPLLKFTNNNVKMGPHVNSKKVATLTWVIGTCVILINMFYLISGLIHWFTNTALPITRIVFLGIIGVAALMAYIGFILYLALRTDRAETYNSPERVEIIMDELNENVLDNL